ncbi:hypothetical protein [Saccharopolyspora taberi]|uniref:Uncharacterized protein n=1 Tax=Saccharopolyspora taberi TaxID=60895 RepID=A0ABN3VMW9_9PSEU
MPAYEEIANRQAELIRKALAGSVFVAPYGAPLPERLTSGRDAALVPLPQGYGDLGWINKDDGVNWARETEVSEVTSWGAWEPTRRDIQSDVTEMTVVAQETNIKTLGMYNNTDLSRVRAHPETGEVSFATAVRPATQYWRVFAVFADGAGDDTIYVGRLLPRAMVSEVGEQVWTDGEDDAVSYEMTLTATRDSEAGFSIRHFFGGPGWRKLLSKMGFEADQDAPATPHRPRRSVSVVSATVTRAA